MSQARVTHYYCTACHPYKRVSDPCCCCGGCRADAAPLVNFTFPMRVKSAANLREFHMQRHTRILRTKKAVCDAWVYLAGAKGRDRAFSYVHGSERRPLVVELTRIAPRPLDTDNLSSAFKGHRDAIAALLGVDDRDPRVSWTYSQEKGKPKEYAVRVTVRAR